MGFLHAALASSLLLATHTAALEPIVMKGSKFFTKSGAQFFLKGVAYQQESGTGPMGVITGGTYVDPLADEKVCKRDVPILEKLGVNTIRTYAINPDSDHSECMKMLEDVGIYVVADLGEPALSINRQNPSWNVELFDRYKRVVDNLGQYDNVIGFFAGNEVTNNVTNTDSSAFVKAAIRDTKKYVADKMSKGGRWMGVGYAANDDPAIRYNMAQYFNCGEQNEAIDFWGYNIYSWCGESSFEQSHYADQVAFFSNYSVPVFFAEYGCNTDGGAEGRRWDETTALYSDEMTGVFSGGIVYMYYEEENDFGLVEVSGDSAKTMKNYDALKSKLSAVKPSSTAMSAYKPTNSPASCPPISDDWKAAVALPPTPDSVLCDCMFKSLSCAPSVDLDEKDYEYIFNYICGNDENACAGINTNTETGVYGPYSMCNPREQLGHVLDAYYINQNKTRDACDFDSGAKLQSSPKVDSSCEAPLSIASSAVSVAATATATTDSSSPDATDSDNASPGTMPSGPVLTLGSMAVCLYMLVSMGVGVAMIAL